MQYLKFLQRTARTIVRRKTPYYAHLCVTERCNLRCRFCQVWQEPSAELTTAQWKTAIEKLDRFGVGFLVFTGGEPLLRKDIYELIEHAAATGLPTAITSNGTMSKAAYARLLESPIDRISISLDGVDVEDIPHSHSGKKIQETVEFIHAHRGERAFTVSTVLHHAGAERTQGVLDFCEQRGIKVFVQPAVCGEGKLRRSGPSTTLDVPPPSRTILNPRYFNEASRAYLRDGSLEWGCLGGQLFFDIKPNGDFWLCQDFPTKLNLLDPDFESKWRSYDFVRDREQCTAGCIYSCYFMIQKGLDVIRLGQTASVALRARGPGPLPTVPDAVGGELAEGLVAPLDELELAP